MAASSKTHEPLIIVEASPACFDIALFWNQSIEAFLGSLIAHRAVFTAEWGPLEVGEYQPDSEVA